MVGKNDGAMQSADVFMRIILLVKFSGKGEDFKENGLLRKKSFLNFPGQLHQVPDRPNGLMVEEVCSLKVHSFLFSSSFLSILEHGYMNAGFQA